MGNTQALTRVEILLRMLSNTLELALFHLNELIDEVRALRAENEELRRKLEELERVVSGGEGQVANN